MINYLAVEGQLLLTDLTVDGSSSSELVRITQTGSGNALVVEDSANPDGTPFVVDSSGLVGVGVTSPLTNLHILAGTATGVSPGTGGRMFIDGNNANMWIDIVQLYQEVNVTQVVDIIHSWVVGVVIQLAVLMA